MQIVRRLRNKLGILKEVALPFRNLSFSATGEDLIVADVFRRMGVEHPFYFDIGTNHPIRINNTFRFYRAGGRGVCVEPQPLLCKQIRHARPRDECLNVGISASPVESLTFYVFDNSALSTFSKEQAELLDSRGPYHLTDKIQVPVMHINDVLARCASEVPTFLSLDCEGMDFEILSSIEFKRHRPAVLCIETAAPSEEGPAGLGPKIPMFDAALGEHGYWAFADTYVNTIYVDRARLRITGT